MGTKPSLIILYGSPASEIKKSNLEFFLGRLFNSITPHDITAAAV